MKIKEFKYRLCDNSRKINEVMNTLLSSWGAEYELSALQVRILFEVGQNGPLTVGGIANNVMVAGTNISTMCKKLEKLGYLKRTKDKIDERIVRIELTEMGIEITDLMQQRFEEKVVLVLDSDLDQRLSSIIAGIEEINRLLNQLVEFEGDEK